MEPIHTYRNRAHGKSIFSPECEAFISAMFVGFGGLFYILLLLVLFSFINLPGLGILGIVGKALLLGYLLMLLGNILGFHSMLRLQKKGKKLGWAWMWAWISVISSPLTLILSFVWLVALTYNGP